MSMLEYNEIKERRFIVLDDEPYEVVSSHVFRKQQRKPVNQTKLKHLVSGRVIERSFAASSDKVEEADIEVSPITYLYTKPATQNKDAEYWFCENTDRSKRFTLSSEIIGPTLSFIKENGTIDALSFNEEIVGLRLPIKVDLRVTEAEPAVKGNTATGATKTVTLETGLRVNTPLFINEGDIVRINTDTGQYTERAS